MACPSYPLGYLALPSTYDTLGALLVGVDVNQTDVTPTLDGTSLQSFIKFGGSASITPMIIGAHPLLTHSLQNTPTPHPHLLGYLISNSLTFGEAYTNLWVDPTYYHYMY